MGQTTGASHLGHFELDRCFQSSIISPHEIPDVCLTIQCRVVKLAYAMTWPHAIDVDTSLLAETVAGVPIRFGFCPLTEVDNLVSQIPTFLGPIQSDHGSP
jgi:hypothetical protein